MNDRKDDIIERYVLPERPFLHGVASAFDMFGLLNRGRKRHLLEILQEDYAQSDTDVIRSAWHRVGASLNHAMRQYEKAAGENGSS